MFPPSLSLHMWIICVIYVLCLSCIVALWSPAWKGLTTWLSFVMLNCIFVTFPCCIQGQVWYLILSIPDLCHLSYFLHDPLSSLMHFPKLFITYIESNFTIRNVTMVKIVFIIYGLIIYIVNCILISVTLSLSCKSVLLHLKYASFFII